MSDAVTTALTNLKAQLAQVVADGQAAGQRISSQQSAAAAEITTLQGQVATLTAQLTAQPGDNTATLALISDMSTTLAAADAAVAAIDPTITPSAPAAPAS